MFKNKKMVKEITCVKVCTKDEKAMYEKLLAEKQEQIEELKVEIVIQDNRYNTDRILADEDFKRTLHILATDNYNTRPFINLVDELGYEKVNQVFIKKLKQKQEAEEKAKEETENTNE